nr:hypothetical protein OG461_35550 [Streptomyces sp. NBC_00995]
MTRQEQGDAGEFVDSVEGGQGGVAVMGEAATDEHNLRKRKMAVSIPLTDDEQATGQDGRTALDRLIDRLADTPTPVGGTPRELDPPADSRLPPLVDVRHGAGSAPR